MKLNSVFVHDAINSNRHISLAKISLDLQSIFCDLYLNCDEEVLENAFEAQRLVEKLRVALYIKQQREKAKS